MKFQSQILLIFILSLLFTLVSTTSFVFFLLNRHNALYENPKIEKALTDAFNSLSGQTESADRQNLYTAITTINQEYVKGKILKKDILITGIYSLLLFLFFQALLLFFLFLFIIKAVTAQLNLIYKGIKQIEGGNSEYRFPLFKGYEFKAIGEELNRMLGKLAEKENIIREQAKLAGWQEVSAFLSHQMKNPLTAITLSRKNVELCLETQGNEDLVRSNLAIIAEESSRLNALLARLKEVSTFPQLNREQIDIRHLIEDVAARYPGEISFVFNFKSTNNLLLDRQLMEQVFLNLFTNSQEAGNGENVVITVAVKQAADKLEIVVSDSIKEVNPRLLEKIFSPRFSTKKGGMGLGLAFVKKIVVMHGGEITVKAVPGAGLVFTIVFPEEMK